MTATMFPSGPSEPGRPIVDEPRVECGEQWASGKRKPHLTHTCQRAATHRGRCLCDCGAWGHTIRKADDED